MRREFRCALGAAVTCTAGVVIGWANNNDPFQQIMTEETNTTQIWKMIPIEGKAVQGAIAPFFAFLIGGSMGGSLSYTLVDRNIPEPMTVLAGSFLGAGSGQFLYANLQELANALTVVFCELFKS